MRQRHNPSWTLRVHLVADVAAAGSGICGRKASLSGTVWQTISRLCHTATVDGYVIEGHVPVREVRRLLEERPSAIGLAVPGMPMGSPGMKTGGAADSYEVLLFGAERQSVFARY
jgi:hypothetical protein